MSKSYFRSLSIAAALLVPFTCAFAAQPSAHSNIVVANSVATTSAPGTTFSLSGFPPPTVPPPTSHELALSGFPPPTVPPPTSHELALSGFPPPTVPPPTSHFA